MRIGLLITSIGNFGQKGFYNTQEIGLAKQLAKDGNNVIVYKLLKRGVKVPPNEDNGIIEIRYSTVVNMGINGLIDTKILDTDLDKLVYFADTQLSVPKVYRWCRKHRVPFISYIGVIDSHSTNIVAKKVMDIMFMRNIRVFSRCTNLVKNTDVEKRLISKGIKNVKVAPVGIDFELLNSDYLELDYEDAKLMQGFKSSDRVVLLAGRLENDRNPLDSVRIFLELKKCDGNFKMLIIGKGSLKEELFMLLRQKGLEKEVKYIEQIPNSEMWKIYRASDILITFSRTEIFGMSILEAMYYGTIVHAISAPGPNDILKNKKNGFLYQSVTDMETRIADNLLNIDSIQKNAHDSVVKQFSWSTTAKMIEEY